MPSPASLKLPLLTLAGFSLVCAIANLFTRLASLLLFNPTGEYSPNFSDGASFGEPSVMISYGTLLLIAFFHEPSEE
jgi:hypothetical protein